MRHALIIAITFALCFITTHVVQAQQCVVTTAQELKDALACIANGCGTCPTCPNGCPTEIIIPEEHPITEDPVVIEIGTELIPNIAIGIEHSTENRPLTITIRGTIEWIDGPSCEQCGYALFIIDGATDLTIDGEAVGRFTSDDLDPEADWLPTAILIRGNSQSITVRDLRFDHLGLMIDSKDHLGTRDTLTFVNLVGEELSEYGIYAVGTNISLQNCRVGDPNNQSVRGTYHFHGFRFYADNLTIEDCIAHRVERFGCWPVSGDDVLIEGFSANAALNFGPNPSLDSGADEHLYRTVIRDAQIASNPFGGLQGMHAELGVWRAAIFDSTTVNEFSIGRGTESPPRATNRIRWSNLSGNWAIATNPDCIGTDIGPVDCWGDIDGNLGVDVDDLIAVILSWDACPAPPDLPDEVGDPCPTLLSPCHADIAPFVIGNNAVDVDDLITVILQWGPCPGFEGEIAGIPEDFQDCMDMCNSCCPATYGACMQRCLAGLCAQGQTQYCD